MCGVTGIFGKTSKEILPEHLEVMVKSLNHRGPDDKGVWVNRSKTLGLGHTRLSIIDLSKFGHQPMISSCGRYVMVFNGEIYNHLEIRKELLLLSKQKVAWRGHSDSETILEAFSVFGIKPTIEKMVGMFALAVWDETEQKLHLARDRMGEKPLFFGWSGGYFVFASELKAIRKSPGFNNKIDRDSLCSYFRYCYVPAPRSIYENIYKLPAGYFMSLSLEDTRSAPKADFKDSNIYFAPYWSLRKKFEEGKKNLITDESEAIEQLDSALRDSIKLQSIADVPLGCFLSGGIDSSLIAALMQSESSSKINTYSIGFNQSQYNEAVFAKKVAQHLGTNHTELYISSEDALSVIPQLPNLYDEPFADSSQIPTYLVSKMARKHVSVALSGDAGDELFGGYSRYLYAPDLWKMISKIPANARPLISKIIPYLPESLLNRLGLLLPGKYKISFLGRKIYKMAPLMANAKTENDLYTNFSSLWAEPEKIVQNAKELNAFARNESLWSDINSFQERMMFLDAMTYLPDDVLTKVDRASMGVSLETRAPFLDHRVVELSMRIPLYQKIKNGQGKSILRKILYKHVPKDLIERPKQGFSIPIESWLRGSLREWGESLISKQRLKEEGFFNVQEVRSTWEQLLRGTQKNGNKLWSILMFQSWLESQG